MDITESKLPCHVSASIDDLPDSRIGPFDAVMHLFEHRYNDRTLFWYGVADVACDFKQFKTVMYAGKPTDLGIDIHLEDGRMGSARHLNSSFETDEESKHTVISLIGWTALDQPKELL